jgi:hypothetical protein
MRPIRDFAEQSTGRRIGGVCGRFGFVGNDGLQAGIGGDQRRIGHHAALGRHQSPLQAELHDPPEARLEDVLAYRSRIRLKDE